MTEKKESVENDETTAKGSADEKGAGEDKASGTEAKLEAKPEVINKWDEFIKPFAAAIGKEVGEVAKALKGLVGEPGDEAVDLLQNVEDTPAADIKDALKDLGVPRAVLGRAIKSLRKKVEVEAPGAAFSYGDILPKPPDSTSFVEMLKIGGILKPGVTEVLCAIKAGLANRTSLYDLPKKIIKKMEAFAEQQDESLGKEFYDIEKLVTRRTYAEIFNALGIPGTSIPQNKKDSFLVKLDSILWIALSQFNQRLAGWYDGWIKTSGNPAMFLQNLQSMFAMMTSGGAGTLPPNLSAPPPTDILHDAGEEVINKVNKVFAGRGIVIARALAYDADRTRAILENPQLPAQIGATNHEQMLKMLGVGITSDYIRLEQNLIRYAFSIVEIEKRATGGNAELSYFAALYNLGLNIPWDRLLSASGERNDSRL